jgi:hypothetical protein
MTTNQPSLTPIKQINITQIQYPEYIKFKKHKIPKDQALVLAALAWNEIRNGHPLERWLIIEAAWNRVINNYNSNGATLQKQLAARKQFYLPTLVFDPKNPYHQENYRFALAIIAGARVADKPIYYWATKTDKGNHFKRVKRKKIDTYGLTKHIFG